jgi:hypothetical protein
MPMLKAKPNEKKKEFTNRCMGDPGMNKEFPNEKQRAGACNTIWGDTNKKKDSYRVDYYPWDDLNDMPDRFKFKKNLDTGFLEGIAIVTNVGVFPYLMEDGTIRNELRPPEEVFNPDSMATLKMKPVTNNHPNVAVTSENIKDFQVGNTGSEVLQDQYHLAVPLVINEEDAIQDVIDGKRGLSQGYAVDIEDTSGTWMGIRYDVIQRNIRYNHTAIVERGRAGDDAVMKFDSLDYEDAGVHYIDNKNFNEKGENFMPGQNLKKFKIDGVEYEAEAPFITAYSRMDKELEALKADNEKLVTANATLEAERDTAKDDAEKLKLEAEKKSDTDPEVIESLVRQRIVVLDAAKRAGVEIKKEDTELDIKKNICSSVYPQSKEKIDAADEQYVNARFDGALEHLDELKNDQDDTDGKLKSDSIGNVDKGKKKDKKDTEFNSDEAYNRMVQDDYSGAYLGKEAN